MRASVRPAATLDALIGGVWDELLARGINPGGPDWTLQGYPPAQEDRDIVD